MLAYDALKHQKMLTVEFISHLVNTGLTKLKHSCYTMQMKQKIRWDLLTAGYIEYNMQDTQCLINAEYIVIIY